MTYNHTTCMTTVTARRMGNSLGFTIPADEAKRLGLHPGDKLDVKIEKVPDISSLFGMFKGQLGDWEADLKQMDAEDARAEARKSAQLDRDLRAMRKRVSRPS